MPRVRATIRHGLCVRPIPCNEGCIVTAGREALILALKNEHVVVTKGLGVDRVTPNVIEDTVVLALNCEQEEKHSTHANVLGRPSSQHDL